MSRENAHLPNPFQKFTPLEKIIDTLFLSTKISSQEKKKYLFSMQLHIQFFTFFLRDIHLKNRYINKERLHTLFAVFLSFPLSKKDFFQFCSNQYIWHTTSISVYICRRFSECWKFSRNHQLSGNRQHSEKLLRKNTP